MKSISLAEKLVEELSGRVVIIKEKLAHYHRCRPRKRGTSEAGSLW
ncbi:hypothetical protein [Legionella oakridgensis]|nr:hypothetical protein [Legionella oakridgensis]